MNTKGERKRYWRKQQKALNEMVFDFIDKDRKYVYHVFVVTFFLNLSD